MLEDYFKLFGVAATFRQDKTHLKMRYFQLQQKAHPDNFKNTALVENRIAVEYAARINEAYRTLTDPLKCAIYWLKQQGVEINSETDTYMPTDFLAEQMILRERVEDPSESLLALQEDVAKACQENEQAFAQIVSEHDSTRDQDLLNTGRMIVRKMQFYQHLAEEIADRVENR